MLEDCGILFCTSILFGTILAIPKVASSFHLPSFFSTPCFLNIAKMSIFTCLAMLLSGKKKSKKSVNAGEDSKKGTSDGKLEVKTTNLAKPSTENDTQESDFNVSNPFPKRSPFIPKVLSNDSMARSELVVEAAYEGGDEHDKIMKGDIFAFDLQAKGELASHRSNTNLNRALSNDRPSTENDIQELDFPVPKSFTKRSSFIPKVLNNDFMARSEFVVETAYDEIMKRDIFEFDLRAKGELASNGSNTDLNNCGSENKMETYEGISPEIMFASGHVSDPGMERTVSMELPVLKRSCSNIETKRANETINLVKNSTSYSDLQILPGNCHNEIVFEAYSSPLSVKTSCSADRVMLKKHSSCQVLPSRSRKLWWKLFLWSHRNLHKSSAPDLLVTIPSSANQKVGYSSDSHEPIQKPDTKKKKKAIEIENQWVAFSLESSPLERVDAWVNSLEDCAFCNINDEENHAGNEDERTAGPHHFEIGESSGKNHLHTRRHAAEEVMQANSIIQSLNSFSSVAHISGMGLKVIPLISAFGNLRSVNLSGNSIVRITLGSLPRSLHTLDLSRNKISTIEGLRDLTRLRVISLSYNRISRIGHGLSNCIMIKELYLAGNKISGVEGLHRLIKLAVLDLSFNKISTAKALGQLVANYNSLLALNLLGNPIQSYVGDDQVRKAVLSLLPRMTFLNRQPIKQHRAREVLMNGVAKAALGDAGRSPQRRPMRRLGMESGSSTKSKIGEGSSRGRKNHSKNKQQPSSFLRKYIDPQLEVKTLV